MLPRSPRLDPRIQESFLATPENFRSPPQPYEMTPTVIEIIHDLSFPRKSKSHARKQTPGHVPRPRNAFILFRCNFVKQRVPDEVISDHRDLSRLAGRMWRQMSDDQKRPWFEKAEMEKHFHSQMFPTYRFTPDRGGPPKRTYTRKKPPVSEEILLHDPHADVRQTVPSPAEPGYSFFHNSLQAGQPNVYPRLESKVEMGLEGIRSCRGENQLLSWSGPGEKIRSPSILEYEKLRPPSPRAFQHGFVQFPKQVGLAEPANSSPYYCRTSWIAGTPDAPGPDLVYSYAVPCSPPPISAPTPSHCDDSLYNMWQDLELFHEQPLHPHSPKLMSNQNPHDDFSNFPTSPSQETSFTPSSTSSMDEIYNAEGYVVDITAEGVRSPVHSP